MDDRYKKVCIVGAGAIGGWLGAGLARAGCEVSMLARGQTLAALQRDGLRLLTGANEAQQTQAHRIRASASAAELGPQDLVVVTVKAPAMRDVAPQLEAVLAAQKVLDSGQTVFAAGLDREPLRELHLLTAKPFLYVFNLDEAGLSDVALKASLSALVAPAEAVFLDAQVESELIEMSEEDALEMLQSMGQEESGLHQLARIGFATLGLQTYLTAGPKESRAWTFRAGYKAPQCAGVIHTDFERGFIRAEVIHWDELLELGSWNAAKDVGKLRVEGKDYVVHDGDVMHFRFNV